MKEPVDHILRPSLPWRPGDDGRITECGYNARTVPSIERAEFFSRLKEFGERRTSMMTCMTCAETAKRHETWEDDPRGALQREIEWERGGRWSNDSYNKRGHLLKHELLAIASLIDAHRAEFDELLSVLEQRHDWLEKKKTMRQHGKPNPMGIL